jgi:hypothetical protein
LKGVLCFIDFLSFTSLSGAHELSDFNRRHAAESPAQIRSNTRSGVFEGRGDDATHDVVHK